LPAIQLNKWLDDNVNDLHIGVHVFHPTNWDSMIELLATKGP